MKKNHQCFVVRNNTVDLRSVFEGPVDAVVEWLKEQSDVSGYRVNADDRGYVTVGQFLLRYAFRFVPRFYRMDPKTEDLLPSGAELADGMKVLIEDPDERAVIKDDMEDWELDRALVRNRWCEVTYLSTRSSGTSISFVAVYEDGTKRKREYSARESWFVKKDSIPDPVAAEEKEAKRYNKVYEIVKAELARHQELVVLHDYPVEELSRHAEETTKKILGTLG
jgi:hypothetical protein